MNRELNQKLM